MCWFWGWVTASLMSATLLAEICFTLCALSFICATISMWVASSASFIPFSISVMCIFAVTCLASRSLA